MNSTTGVSEKLSKDVSRVKRRGSIERYKEMDSTDETYIPFPLASKTFSVPRRYTIEASQD